MWSALVAPSVFYVMAATPLKATRLTAYILHGFPSGLAAPKRKGLDSCNPSIGDAGDAKIRSNRGAFWAVSAHPLSAWTTNLAPMAPGGSVPCDDRPTPTFVGIAALLVYSVGFALL